MNDPLWGEFAGGQWIPPERRIKWTKQDMQCKTTDNIGGYFSIFIKI